MQRLMGSLVLASALIVGGTTAAFAGEPIKTQIWLDGAQVGTILPPASTPGEGTDMFFMVPGTGGVAAVGPGDRGYHGGHWAVYVVSWNVAMYPLTSHSAIMAAHTAGDISVSRVAAADFICPIRGH